MSEEETTIDLDDIEPKLEELRTHNIERLNQLTQAGYGMNPLMQLKLRLDALTTWAIDPSVASAFELMYEALMSTELDEIENEVRKLGEQEAS